MKVLRWRADERHQARFLREARAVAALSHPNIIRAFEIDPAGRFLVLELAARSLADELRERGPLDAARLRRLASEVLSALEKVHGAGVVHRDIKPSNILLADDGSARLADFGIAHMTDSDLTRSGEVIGTPCYMAPEQLRGVVDPRVDVYGLGAVLYEAATGEAPTEIEASAVRRAVLRATGDRGLARAVERALAPDRSRRHASAAAFARALERRRRAPALGIALGMAAAAAVAWSIADAPDETSAAPARAEAARPASTHVVALLPFTDDRGRDANPGFAQSGLPHIVGMEVRRHAAARTIGYYRLLDRVPERDDPDAWESTARQLGATVAVDGRLSSSGEQTRLRLVARRLDGPASAPQVWERVVERDDIGRVLRSMARDLAAWLGATPAEPSPNPPSISADRALAEGLEALERHDLDAAQVHFEEAQAAAPRSADISYHLAIVYWWRGDTASALAQVAAASTGALDGQRRETLRGLRLLVERRHLEAIEVYEGLLERDPRDRDVLYGLFEALYHAGRGERAMQVYRRLVEVAPAAQLGAPHAETYYLARGDREGLDWLGANSTRHQHLVLPFRVAFAERRYGDAIAGLERLAEDASIAGGSAYPLRLLGQAHLLAGDREAAHAVIESLGPGPDRALLRLTAAIVERAPPGELERLRRELDAAVADDSRYGPWLRVATVDLAQAPLARLSQDTARLAEHRPEGDLRTDLVAVFVALRRGDLDALTPLTASPYPVVARAAQAARAELERRPGDALDAWAQASGLSVDGRLVPLMHLRRARAAASLGRDALAREACDRATHPRVFDGSWASARVGCDALGQ